MQISVVIPVYNRQHTLKRALDSVMQQSSPADEVIVVDDGSTDQSADIVSKHFPQVRLLRQPNKGVSAARNAGIRSASSDWIALLDSDDEWLPQKLATVRDAFGSHPQEVLFHSDEIWIRDGVRVNAMNKHRKRGGMIFEYCLPLCVISPSAAVIHRSVFDRVGLFNEALPACEDYDLWLRLCQCLPVFYIDRPLIRKYGGHADQLSRKYWGMDRFRIRALHALMQQPGLTPQQQQQTQDMIVRKLGILIKGARKHQNHAVLEEFEPLLTHYQSSTC